MKTHCIVVVGHVDHGKTSLVHALTGIETDRLPEEKARGLSIAPGFAHRGYADGIIDFVDAPGHEDFIQAMISSATGAGSVLVVISIAEGIGAQTLEHLSIAGLLGITSGVIAITKSDLIRPSEQAARLIEIRDALSRTAFANAILVICSSRTGDGLDTLKDALEGLLSQDTGVSGPLQSFLPIDRVFSLPGRGTIVTGTLLGQSLAVDDVAVLLPACRNVTIRGLQSRGIERGRIQVGERMAANLRGVAVTDITRGAVLCAGDAGAPSTCIDAHINLLPSVTLVLKHMQDVRVLFGTSSEVAQVRLYGGGRMGPTYCGYAQLRFKKPVIGYAGQRAILRQLSPSETIGGAVFLDPQATLTRSGDKSRLQVLEAARLRDVEQIAGALSQANQGVASILDIARLAQITPKQARANLSDTFVEIGTGSISSKESIEACKAEVLRALAAYHAKYPLRMRAPRTAIANPSISPVLLHHVEAALLASGQMRDQGVGFVMNGHDPITSLNADQLKRMIEIENTFNQAQLAPPTRESLSQGPLDNDLIELLIETKRLVSLQNVALRQSLVFHTDTLAAAAEALSDAFPTPQSFTTGEARTALTTSRKIIVPILEYFDAQGVTIRKGDARQMIAANVVSPLS